MKAILASIAVLVLPVAAIAQPDLASLRLNEVYASHAGTDNLEMIELIGTPGASLDRYVVCIIEGQGAGAGTLDRAWDLTGNVMPNDGFFLLGNTAEPAKDFDIGLDNIIENGTETFYVVEAPDAFAVASILGLIGTNVDGNADLITDLTQFAIIRDVVAMWDGDTNDFMYDNAYIVGPDNVFFPAGIYRNGDYPNAWCDRGYLDFDPVINVGQPRTPGAPNGGCYFEVGPGCASLGGLTPNLAFSGTSLPGSNISLQFSNVTPPNAALLFVGFTEVALNLNLNCLLYVGPPTTTLVFALPAAAFSIPATIPASTPPVTVFVQLITQDVPGGPGLTSNGMGMQVQ